MKIDSTSKLVLLALASLSIANGLVIPQTENSSLEKITDVEEIQALFAGKTDKDLVEIVMNYITSSSDVVVTAKTANSDSGLNIAPMVDGSSKKKDAISINNKYIVVLKKGITKSDIAFNKELIQQLHLQSFKNLSEDDKNSFQTANKENEFGIESKNSFGGIEDSFNIGEILNGFVGYFTPQVINLIRMLPIVDYVEKDSMVFTQDFQVENGAPWGLARISHRDKLSLGSFNKYLYDSEGGEGVTAYVVDTGVNIEHENFEGRAVWGKTIPFNDEDIDGNGHGTHCAGTIGSVTYGVAKKADIVAVKVLRSNGSGSMSDVVKGVEYVANDHLKNGKNRKASTANMSLGGGNSPTLDMAVNAAVEAGIHFAVAAGNEDQDACNSSPASAANPITVGASTLSDDRAYFSNWGKCVDLFAPGLNILSTYIGSTSATAVLSGTSMASPHVCGLLTYFLSLQPDSDSAFAEGKIEITPAFMKAKLLEYGTKDVLNDIDANTPNVLIFNGAGEDLSSFWQSPTVEEAVAKDPLTLESIVDTIVSEVEHFGLDSVRNSIKELL
ncbi:related to Subtilisin-like protease 8 [Hanseniaspora guilliermondii]|uniref:Related to Subtilisin-like protease 8 n=1 Tax=Hanseniaspora guilliermondii TaxID=56406 RepID=A0A1L0FFZ4_9ASCO|nr:related to Subtilisin-like protease 8 [Hanseniaspora guilliermondii]